ncbi:MAG: hypothetical protein HN368_19875 [Spirochaetales bacterium]|nr:hypothetical protein [Spirochaetales bacterium]
MIRKLPINITTLLVFAVLTGQTGFGDTPLRDPGIPDGEIAAYTMREKDKEQQFIETFQHRDDGNKDIYSVLYTSDSEVVEVKIDRSSMLPYYVHSSTERETMDVETLTSLTLNTETDYPDIKILSFSDLKYVLRGFPFADEVQSIDIGFLNSSDEDEEDGSFDFNIRVNYEGTETVDIGNKDIDCYKLELKMRATGIMRIINSFIAKTYFWYSVESPHYLVAYEGSSGFPGSSKVFIEIDDYSGWR